MKMQTSPWSDNLLAQTREAINDMRGAPDGLLHFKHKKLGYGTMNLLDLASKTLILQPKEGTSILRFGDAQALLDAGWAID